MPLKLFSRRKAGSKGAHKGAPASVGIGIAANYQPAPYAPPSDDELRRGLENGRYAAILGNKAQWEAHADCEEVFARCRDAMEERMALVPAGGVSLAGTLSAQPGGPERDIPVEPYLLDIHCVTNARYQRFVDAGGYDALEYWPEEIWPHLIELKDLTGQPGPRCWRHGRHDLRLAQHPVVGVSWYEAQAYALWIGQRLPSEAEWQMAASWHIRSSTDVMRRFPWGDSMDSMRCNLWASRASGTVPVDAYPEGAAPNQVLQLVGNVWEWCDCEYTIADDMGKPIVGEMPMHVVRGGAFDTYFESQATSLFRTGQVALSRSHNTGFRCAMNLSDASWINGS